MASQGRRAKLFDEFAGLTSKESAEELMTAFPPRGWDEIATKDDLRVQTAELRTDLTNQLHTALDGLGSQLRSEISGLRSDLRAEISGVRSEISGVRSEISGVRSEVNGVQAEIRALRSWRWNTLLASAAIIASFVVGTLVR
jgi:hypothetical protein